MHLVIDATWHQPQPSAVFDLGALGLRLDVGVRRTLGQIHPACHDVFPIDKHVLHLDSAVVDDVGMAKQGAGIHCARRLSVAGKKIRLNRIWRTPRSASRKMFMLILEVPNSRSTNVMGTSLTR